MSSFYDELKNRASATPELPAAFTVDQEFSYETLFALSRSTAAGLNASGIKAGDRVAVHLGNRYELISVYFALLGLGAVIVPIALRVSAGEISYMLQHGGVRYYIGDAAYYDACRNSIESTATIERAWVLDLTATVGKVSPFSDLLVESEVQLEPVPPESMAAILYSSGTTGLPKGVVYSHATLHKSVELLGATLDKAAAQGSERAVGICSVVDLVSAWSLLMNLTAMRRGRPLAISTIHTPDLLLNLLRTGRVGWIGGAPSNFRALLDAVREGKETAVDLSQTNCIAGGDACPSDLSLGFRETFATPLQSSYGQTETGGPVIYHHNLSGEREPALGWKLDQIEIRIDAQPGEAGELWIKSPAKPLGTWNGKSIDPFEDDWLYTGDLVKMRKDDSCIMFLSRIKDVMKIGGFALAPFELEQALEEHPDIAAAAVFSIPDHALGERAIAMIQVQTGAHVSKGDITRHLTGRIANYKHPGDIVFVDKIPFAPSGKLARKKLSDEYLASLKEPERLS
ncbi:AMP-binding protein [Rhizobium helianthi]|uniref:AMP-binding protein n=1 Tax=Rhizobium helianthi TaxID=1132695 RepID=A0ABW4M3N1_9HYPH